MKIIRPQLERRIEGKTSLASLTPLRTLTSKNLNQSASEIASNGVGSKIPRLLTRICMPGCSRTSCSADDATLKSPANPRTAVPVSDASDTATSSTNALDRPLTMTRAPSRARVLAIARPMPAVLPVISASLSFNFRSMSGQRACALVCVRRQRYEFRVVRIRQFHSPGPPIRLSLLDTLLGGGNEVPLDEALSNRLAAQ